ncbi:hypothetical protein [Photobacterium chitinilyticum]|uniref:Uncharacterized protein n=1 Tax=Photobacterium chitinilyticum TaxID=2485123 RepID=A0A444JVW4_9GAMM|nr:hypothetical protein [Photobacterium chitinilyticum]RWX57206.1 hypothetical protein EDI28_04020 [Photobacterium chitinilyticum]
MATLKEFVELVDHLIELTQEKTITWLREEAPSSLMINGSKVKHVYTTEYNNKNLRIYEELYKYYTDEDEYHWQNRTIIDFVDGEDSIFEFPQTSNSWDLLKAIQYRDVDIDGFMNDILKRK